jgi:replicative DNA helicase
MLDHAPPFAEPEDYAPPSNIEAEQAVLGAVLYENEVYWRVSDLLRPEHFYDPLHARIYEAITAKITASELADAVTLRNQFEADAGMAEIGGAVYLADLMREAPGAASAVEYAKLVIDLALRRELIALGSDMVRDAEAMSDDAPANEIFENAEVRLSALAKPTRENMPVTAVAAYDELLDQIENPAGRIMTGLVDLDEQIGGFRPGGYNVLAGRSSMGKSSLAIDLAWRVANGVEAADQPPLPSIIITIEMPPVEVSARIASSLSGVEYRRLLHAKARQRLSEGDMERLHGVRAAINAAPLTYRDAPGVKVSGIRSILRRWRRGLDRDGLSPGLVVIDYMQQIRADEGGSLYERTTGISRALKPMFRELGVAGVVACQLSRGGEKEGGANRPAIHHLRDSGAIEEDADAIMLLYRPAYYAQREPENADPALEHDRRSRASSRLLEVDVAKNRQGAVGRVELWANIACNEFRGWR